MATKPTTKKETPTKTTAKKTTKKETTEKKATKKDATPKTVAKKTVKKVAKSITENDIRVKAQEIYDKRIQKGLPGNAETDWLEAEKELRK